MSSDGGLDPAQAAQRLQRDGPNALPEPERRSRLAIIGRVLREPMLLLLLGATAVYLLLGDPREALLLGASVILVVGLTVFQEQKAERALQALRELGSPHARVLRDGQVLRIDATGVVVGDHLLVDEGERVAADARVLEGVELLVDESLLTGESVPVGRAAGDPLHAGTLAVRGRATAEVTATGPRTEMGRIGASLRAIRPESTPMQAQVRSLVLLFALLSALACASVALLYWFTRGGWLDALLAGLTLAMTTVPEEFPVVLTVFLALGAWRIAQQQALVRRAPAIETLGATTVLCTDKTGTLTENRMAVAELATPGEHCTGAPGSPALRDLLRLATLASPSRSLDPMEQALHAASAALAGDPDGTTTATPDPVREYPFSSRLQLAAMAWRAPDGSILVACKGAPERVARLCGLSAGQRDAELARAGEMAARGLRVLGVAVATRLAPPLPETPVGLAFAWRGLVAFADPLRAGVAAAVAEAHAAGVRVLLLTGDHAATARAIAGQAGIASAIGPVEGEALDAMSEAELQVLVAPPGAEGGACVFARVRPEHKLRLVRALRTRGGIVAMTGDGVNDAPALMAAHVGIAMGVRGTDVAREAAAIVLLDDNFVTIVRAMRLGRTIYDNIRRALHYVVAVHVPITGLALLPLLAGGPLVLLPLHVVLLELVIDPACTLAFEREPGASDVMRRRPRPARQPLLGAGGLLASLAQGLVMFAAVALVHTRAMAAGLPAPQAGALAFAALVAGNIGLILVYRAGGTLAQTLRQRNAAFWWIAGGAAVLLLLTTRAAPVAAWLGFQPPPFAPWLAAVALPLACAVAMKALHRMRARPHGAAAAGN